jgi:hypothetical protein
MNRRDRRREKRPRTLAINPASFVTSFANTDDQLEIVGRVRCMCGRPVDVAERKSDAEPCLLHPLPTCAFFDESSPDRFLQAIRSRDQGTS